MTEKLAIILGVLVIILGFGCYALYSRGEAKDSQLEALTQRAELLEADNKGLRQRNKTIDEQVRILEARDEERTGQLQEQRVRMEGLREENAELRELLDTRIPGLCLFGLPVWTSTDNQ